MAQLLQEESSGELELVESFAGSLDTDLLPKHCRQVLCQCTKAAERSNTGYASHLRTSLAHALAKAMKR